MKMIVNIKTKQQEKRVKNFLADFEIEFMMFEEEEAIYKTALPKPLTKKEKQILDNLSQSVDFINQQKKGKVKAKPLNQLLNEL